MPTYNFINEETREEFSAFLSFSERESFLAENPHIRQLPPSNVNLVSGVAGITHKTDDGWKENLQRIAEAHPTSEIAKHHGDKGIKASKTRQVVDKWKKSLGGSSSVSK